MSIDVALPSELRALAERLLAQLGNSRAGAEAVRLVREHAPDERLALVSMLKLGEQSPALLNRALGDPKLAIELMFCLGASELVAAGLCALESEWLDFFEAARGQTLRSLLDTLRSGVIADGDREAAGRALGAFRRRHFLQIAIADLIGRFSVAETMAAMSQLADESIRAALSVALRLVGTRADMVRGFCVLAMGKLGVH